MKIREETSTNLKNPKTKELMEKFWESYDKLFKDMDNLSIEEYVRRNREMWSWRNKASEVEGDYFILSLYGMDNKAEKLYGKEIHNVLIENILNG